MRERERKLAKEAHQDADLMLDVAKWEGGRGHKWTHTQVARADYVETDSNLMYTYYRPCFIACRVDDRRHDPVGFTVTLWLTLDLMYLSGQ